MALGIKGLSDKDVNKIAVSLKDLIKQDEAVVVEQDDPKHQEVTDPSLEPYYKAEAELVKQVGINGGNVVVYRGKYGCTRVNTTMEALDNIRKMIKDRKAGFHSNKF